MVIGVNKPKGITSHDLVNRIRRITGERRVGHGGTLDPFAEGVLVVGITRESTRKLHEILKNTDKEYIGTLVLGKTSTTGDPEGDITDTGKDGILTKITEENIRETLKKFTGEIEQTPPAYSAVKVKGVPAYKRVRNGENVNLDKRKVRIKELELIEFTPPALTIRTVVSSGTYIRSLAEDIGEALGTGAYLKELTRTKVGDFTLENSKTLKQLEESL